MNLEIGSIVGDYQIIDTLGAGGMGKVFKVRNTISDRIEAMKVLLPDLAGESELGDRFLREIKVLASLDHPNIAGLRTALRQDNQLLMVMEFVEGMTLEQRLQQGPLPVPEAIHCISQVLSALAYAHQRGVIHRDIKPANMMLMPDGTVKLMDFGIAKGAADRKLTMTGTTMGSLYYMSPEQIRGEQTLDLRADLYSVGVSLYELVTGKRPFDGDSQFAIMSAHLEKTPVPPVTIDPTLPAALNDLILLSVTREPEGRFQKAEAFQKALGSVLGGREPTQRIVRQPTQPMVAAAPPPPPVSAGPPPVSAMPPPESGAQPRSRRALWAGVGALCCVGMLVAAIQFGPWKKAAADSPVVPAPAQAATAPASQPAAATGPATEPVATTPAPVTPAPVTPAPVKPASASAGSAKLTPGAPPSSTSALGRVRQMSASPVQSLAPLGPQQTGSQAPGTAPPPVVDPTPKPPAPDLAAQRAEQMKARESMARLSARALAVHNTLRNLQRSQAASGLGMRSDWVQASSLMDTFFQGANDALAANDLPAARDLMDKGEQQLEKLEKALNK